MDKCAIQFMARHWWRRVEVWFIAMLLVTGGVFFGFQLGQWSLADSYRQQVAEIRAAYDEATLQRDHRLDELTRKAGTAADKATKAAANATQAAEKADEALNRVAP
jgi:predicted negative regulator of RcsB-dependent stress response